MTLESRYTIILKRTSVGWNEGRGGQMGRGKTKFGEGYSCSSVIHSMKLNSIKSSSSSSLNNLSTPPPPRAPFFLSFGWGRRRGDGRKKKKMKKDRVWRRKGMCACVRVCG